jgi:hypothetical protein
MTLIRLVLTILLASIVVAGTHANATTRALVVAGLGGEPQYQSEFQRQATAGARQLKEVASEVSLLLGEQAGRDHLRRAIEGLAERSAAADTLVVMLIGHGSYDDLDYRFNVPGADVTGDELTRWLDAVPASHQLVVTATSASGALQSLLTDGRRTVITATRSGGERNVTVFADYFTASLTDTTADTDKDGYVSAIEAFRFAEAGISAHYGERNQMATEHPTLQGPETTVVLARLEATPAFDAGSGMERRQLETLEADIAALRADKANQPPDAYYAELQRLLLEVALLRRRVGEERAP